MMSIIIPAYNEEENIENTASVISGIMEENKIPCEILFVDDGSKDRTWELIEKLAGSNPAVRGLKFSRNFGKEGAIFAGLKHCRGDCAAVIDCDLQHPPQLMVQMYNLWQQGYQVVEAVKASRGKESFLYKFFAQSFYGLMEGSSNIKIKGGSDYKLMDRQVINALNELPERITFYRALSSWVGFKTTQLEFNVAPRNAGTTKWNFKKLFKFALANLTSFTSAPLHFVTVMGIISFIAAVALGVIQIVKACQGVPQNGILPVLLLVGAVLMLGLGIIGYYMSKIYEEIKGRPRYLVCLDTLNRDNDTNSF
ncbi:MAG: glycosyltransferase family 2 protein [Ruminococcaceae bacterium]|nr:glycosyltransferase family 2 protein [Oscillospiraceae bacterium]